MSDSATPDQPSGCCSNWFDSTWAFLLMRFWLALRFITAGMEKFYGASETEKVLSREKLFAVDPSSEGDKPVYLNAKIEELKIVESPEKITELQAMGDDAALVEELEAFDIAVTKFYEPVKGYGLDYYAANQEAFLNSNKGMANHPLIFEWTLKPFAFSLGFILLITGVCLLLGVKSRIALIVMGLTYITLSMGAFVTANQPLISSMIMHLFVTAAALSLVGYERLALWPGRRRI